MSLPKVVILRGYSANPWDLRPWSKLSGRFSVSCVATRSNVFKTTDLPVESVRLRCTRDFFPNGKLGDMAAYAAGERYFGLEEVLTGAQIVHGAELGTWFTSQAAALKHKLGFKLVTTVWETVPFLNTYRRYRPTRRYRANVLAETDLFLPTTERALRGLLLEGVPAERICLSPPGIDTEHFAAGRAAAGNEKPQSLILSPGRLVWEKGHQDVIRALAALKRGIVPAPAETVSAMRLVILGSGSDRNKLVAYADELGVGDSVEVRAAVDYDRMPALYGQASCMVLASLPIPSWEEQFGMVLAEAMAAGVPIFAARSGAIPEVLAGQGQLFDPGDWAALASQLAEELDVGKGGRRVDYSDKRLRLFSGDAAAERLAAVYGRFLERGHCQSSGPAAETVAQSVSAVTTG